MAHRRHHLAIAAQQLEVIGDVAGAAAEVAAQRGHQERHIEHVDAVGQDVVLELAFEHHHRVVGDRAADQCRHTNLSQSSSAHTVTNNAKDVNTAAEPMSLASPESA